MVGNVSRPESVMILSKTDARCTVAHLKSPLDVDQAAIHRPNTRNLCENKKWKDAVCYTETVNH